MQDRVTIGVEIRALSALRSRLLDVRWTFSFSSFTTVPACLDLTHGEGLPGGLLEASCGRCSCRSMQNQLNVDTFMPASEYETLIRRRCGKKIDCTCNKIADTTMICALSIFIEYLQTVHRKVQYRQFAAHMYSLCVPGLLVAASISRNT